MSSKRHGLAIGIDRINDKFFVSLTAQGKLTHDDYLVITPMIDNALAAVEQPQVKMLIDATQLEGWELQAAWDDFKLGLKHGSEFEKIAIIGNKRWQQWAAKIGSWFISGDVAYFEDEESALAWLD
ncbi:STAS/SEC14 domain-containing protein [Thalassotalea ponticola]|uniref:STAS/SEC14 domain-containing protein n=1 Tax=Thalassotalea ponticola TaxID=1523392 RepID=UPI0025B56F47|nr:STAS/SEC14 domain-containing protein [Thalassotalea ponticola]MDN3653354.1 STAS/SEC14 domain-containing protein [Thalassotalea ponticola]